MWDPKEYDERWKRLAAEGKDPHGEVAFLEALLARNGREGAALLDAGCGTGRVAIELALRGWDVVGTDIDAAMLAEAEEKAPHIAWHAGDLAHLDLGRCFDAVVMAGNVILFVDPATRSSAAARIASHLVPRGLLVAGFQLDRPGVEPVALADWDRWLGDVGMVLIERWSSWDGDAFGADAAYAVSVHRLER